MAAPDPLDLAGLLADPGPTTVADPEGAWAGSGAMALTGTPDVALAAPAGLTRRLAGLGGALARASASAGRPVVVDALALLGERAALSGLVRQGEASCGGGTRLLAAADGWLAVSLGRPDDVDLLAAWLGRDLPPTDDLAPWTAVAATVAGRRVADLDERAALVGLPVGVLGSAGALRPVAEAVAGDPAPPVPFVGALVVDLSSLWAGPLCAQLLGLAGARVVKVESTRRPDGARSGPAPFYDLLHAGHQSVALDFERPDGRRALADLVAAADVVIEGSRPRALEQLGLVAHDLVAGGPRVWLSITGHGRREGARRVAFGDDAAVAGGLVARHRARPLFCADAVADPVTGLVAAAGTLAAWARGGRWLLDVPLAGTAAVLAEAAGAGDWLTHRVEGGPGLVVAPPKARPVTGRAPDVGRDTRDVLAAVAAAHQAGPAA